MPTPHEAINIRSTEPKQRQPKRKVQEQATKKGLKKPKNAKKTEKTQKPQEKYPWPSPKATLNLGNNGLAFDTVIVIMIIIIIIIVIIISIISKHHHHLVTVVIVIVVIIISGHHPLTFCIFHQR